MGQESELQRLEKFVQTLLTRFTALKAEKEKLEQDLLDSELLVEELQSNISVKDSERTEISERVNKIVDQIEEWEQSLDDAAVDAGDSSAEVVDGQDGDSLAEISGEEEINGEDEGRVQHNLFSIGGSKE